VSQANPRGTYLRIADALRAEIGDGSQVKALPSEADLMEAHGVARSTVGRALKLLASEGLIASQPGVGWLVAGQTSKPPVFDQIAGLIASDNLKIGDQFPSEKELCEKTSASRGTVRRALAQLEGAGILEARHGKGRFVRALPATDRPMQPL